MPQPDSCLAAPPPSTVLACSHPFPPAPCFDPTPLSPPCTLPQDTRHAFTTGCTTENSASARAAPAAPHCLPVSLVAAALNAASGAHAAAVAGAGADGDIDIDENDAVVLCEAVLAGEDVAAVPRMGRRVRALRSPARCRDV